MYTLKVKVFETSRAFDVDAYDSGVITMNTPTIPRIGEQLINRTILNQAKDVYEDLIQGDYHNDTLEPKAFTYVNNIAYGDNSVIYIGLSFNPQYYICLFFEMEGAQYWALIPDLPRIGDSVHYPEGCNVKDRRFVVTVNNPDSHLIAAQTAETVVYPVQILNTVDTKVLNTVDTNTYVENIVDVNIHNEPIDVKVKDVKGYVYTKNYNGY